MDVEVALRELTGKGDNVIGYFMGAKTLLELDEILMSRW
jgi:hypothetical protein